MDKANFTLNGISDENTSNDEQPEKSLSQPTAKRRLEKENGNSILTIFVHYCVT